MSFIELNWLAKADKYIPLPIVVFTPLDYCGGFFAYPQKKEGLIGEKYYPLDRGLIAVDDRSSNFSSTLAHEWRHLWQLYNLGKKDYCHRPDASPGLPYKQRIIKYFLSDARELDALLFQRKKVYAEYAERWYEWIIKHKEVDHVLL